MRSTKKSLRLTFDQIMQKNIEVHRQQREASNNMAATNTQSIEEKPKSKWQPKATVSKKLRFAHNWGITKPTKSFNQIQTEAIKELAEIITVQEKKIEELTRLASVQKSIILKQTDRLKAARTLQFSKEKSKLPEILPK